MSIEAHSKKRQQVAGAEPASEVERKTPSGCLSLKSSWGEPGTADGQFDYPYDVAVGMNGHVYVTDLANNRIQCFNSTGAFIRKWGKLGSDDGEFYNPHGLSIGIRDGKNKLIWNTMRTVPELNLFPPGLLPICVAYMGEECIAVTEEGNCRIQIFDLDGTFIRKWGTRGSEDGHFRGPAACCIDPSGGILYVADSFNHRIQAFDLNGTFLYKWGSRGSGDAQFIYPLGISIGSNGFIYVCDNNMRISCFAADGVFIRHIPTPMHSVITAIVEVDNSLYMCSEFYHCIYQCRLDGSLLSTFGSGGSRNGQFRGPRSIISANNGLVYLTDCSNDRIVRLHH